MLYGYDPTFFQNKNDVLFANVCSLWKPKKKQKENIKKMRISFLERERERERKREGIIRDLIKDACFKLIRPYTHR